MNIPCRLRIGGQLLEVELPENIEGDKLGKCCLSAGIIKIAQTFSGLKQSESSQMNTFFHEVVHAILDTMGRSDLSSDEVFVNTFASFMTEAYFSAEFGKAENP